MAITCRWIKKSASLAEFLLLKERKGKSNNRALLVYKMICHSIPICIYVLCNKMTSNLYISLYINLCIKFFKDNLYFRYPSALEYHSKFTRASWLILNFWRKHRDIPYLSDPLWTSSSRECPVSSLDPCCILFDNIISLKSLVSCSGCDKK